MPLLFILHGLNVCGMQCTSEGIYTQLKLVVRMLLDSPTEGLLLCLSLSATPSDGCQQLFVDQLKNLTDRPHKVND